MDHQYREARRVKAHETLAARHPILTLYGRTIAWTVGWVLAVGTLANCTGIL